MSHNKEYNCRATVSMLSGMHDNLTMGQTGQAYTKVKLRAISICSTCTFPQKHYLWPPSPFSALTRQTSEGVCGELNCWETHGIKYTLSHEEQLYFTKRNTNIYSSVYRLRNKTLKSWKISLFKSTRNTDHILLFGKHSSLTLVCFLHRFILCNGVGRSTFPCRNTILQPIDNISAGIVSPFFRLSRPDLSGTLTVRMNTSR